MPDGVASGQAAARLSQRDENPIELELDEGLSVEARPGLGERSFGGVIKGKRSLLPSVSTLTAESGSDTSGM